MKHRNSALAAACLLSVGLAGMLPGAAHAQAGPDDWKFGAHIYGWFPAIGGSTSFPPAGGGPSIDVSTQQVIDALKMAFMGSLEGRKGQWGFWTDVVYANFGASKSGFRQFEFDHAPVPVDLSADLNLDIKSWIWTVAGTYNLVSKPDYTLDMVGGARLLDMTNKLDYAFSASASGHPLAGRSGTAEVTGSFWDAIVGVKGRANFGDDRKWFIPYYLDVGTGQSKLTWSVNAGLGYEFGWGAVLATWRYMDYSFKSGSKIESINFNGPTIGVAFSW
jgi:hypothetical protein